MQEKIKALIDNDFLAKLLEVGKLYGWEGDYIEIKQFISDLHSYAGIELPDNDLEAYELDEDETSGFVFREGDQARVIGRYSEHGFDIGDIVRVLDVEKNIAVCDYIFCEGVNGETFYLKNYELEAVQSIKPE